MSKFNSQKQTTVTRNYDGHKAYSKSAKLDLVQILLSSFLDNSFYESGDQTIDRLAKAVHSVDPIFAMKAAIFARDKFNMRSTSHVVAGELATIKNIPGSDKFFEAVVVRPDDMLEIISYYSKYAKARKNGKIKLPRALARGFKKAFDKFDDYSLAKYRCENKAFSLVDLVNLVRPVPTDHNEEALSLLVQDKLRATDTWETKLTQAGQAEGDTDELKNAAWTKLLKEKKLKPFALLRNLRNIKEQAPEMLQEALDQLVAAKKTRILPFRFYTAYKELGETPRVAKALSKCIEYSDIPEFLEGSVVAVDISGSMTWSTISSKSKILVSDIACFMGAFLAKSGYADVLAFSDEAAFAKYNAADSVFTIAEKIDKATHSNGTNFESIFKKLDKPYKRIIILSDMQANIGQTGNSALAQYKKRTGCDPYVYCWDLRGYSTTQFPKNGKKICHLAGFSEKVFDLMKYIEEDPQALINAIEGEYNGS